MESQRWRDRLLTELHRQGLPSGYVSRLVEELTDHAADLFEENPSMDAEQNADARLGTPEHLAAVARAAFQKRTFAGRHPALTFLVGPVVTVVGTVIGTVLLLIVVKSSVAWTIDTATGGSLSVIHPSGWRRPVFVTRMLLCYSSILQFVPFAVSAWIFAWLGRRSNRPRWSMAACGLIAVIALFFWSGIVGAPADPKNLWLLGFGFNLRIGLAQIVQAAVPLALGAWLLRRADAGRRETLAA